MDQPFVKVWEPCPYLCLEWRGLRAAQHNIKPVASSPLGPGCFHIELGNHALPGLFVRHRLKNRIEGKQGITGKVHLRDQTRNESLSKDRKVYMGGPPGIVVVEPGIRPRLNGHETISAMFVRKRSSSSGEIRVERRWMLVLYMGVAARRVCLPDFNQ